MSQESLSRVYEEMEPGYYDRAFHRGRGVQWFWQQHRLRQVRECLPSEPKRIIDLGCGPGTFLGNFVNGRSYALGVDFAEPQIEYARSHYGRPGLDFQRADVIGFEHESPFDSAVSIEVIEHLPRDKTHDFLETLRRLLEPGGTLVLVTPNYASAWPITERLISRFGAVDYVAQHINRFTRGRLVAEAVDAGFVVERCQTFFVVAPFLAAASTYVAERLLTIEATLLPRIGSELLLVARRPSGG
jgi:2-polyprenyl-3-methyl-5-hydroxy-6-metoxy-1,4-benzoquinol methylase